MIIFNHMGLSWYQDPVFECVRKSNPKEDIVLIGDDENKYLAEKHHFTFVHKDSLPYPDRYRGFLSNVQIIGTVKGEVGLKTTLEGRLRWFRIYTFLKSNGIKNAWYFDSDVLICSNLSYYEGYYNNKPYWIIDSISGSSTRINDIEYLNELCETIYKLHTDEQFTYKQRLLVLEKLHQGKQYNFCDMTCIHEFRKNNEDKVGDLSVVILNKTFDPNINMLRTNSRFSPYQFEGVESKRGEGKVRKKIYYHKDSDTLRMYPYCYDLSKKIQIKMHTLNMSWLPPQEFSQIYKPLQTQIIRG